VPWFLLISDQTAKEVEDAFRPNTGERANEGKTTSKQASSQWLIQAGCVSSGPTGLAHTNSCPVAPKLLCRIFSRITLEAQGGIPVQRKRPGHSLQAVKI
jgi:hypothetical protein